MNKFIFLSLVFSCAAIQKSEQKDEYKDLAVCKNTLQQGIHRDECMR